MVLAAVEQYEKPERRLVQDDLAASFLPGALRAFVGATRPSLLRRLVIATQQFPCVSDGLPYPDRAPCLGQ